VFELRSFQPSDAEAVWGLHDAALSDAGVHGGRGPWEDDLRDVGATYLDSGGDFLVALASGRLVGMAGLLCRSPGEAEIRRMRVHPDFQRRGLGRLMLRELEGRAQALGLGLVCLDTTEEQIAARRLYEGAGYREVGRRRTDRFVFIDFAKTLRAPDMPQEVEGEADKAPVLIVTGPPGVGKTTTAAILADRAERAVHLEADAFFRFIRSGYVEPWHPRSREQNGIVMRLVGQAGAGYAEAGYSTIIDGIVIPTWFLEPLRDQLRDAGHRVAYVVLRAPLSVCRARVEARQSEMPVDSGAIEQLWKSFADLGDLERNVVDVEGGSPEMAADLVAQRLADGALSI